jgi:homocitrate synthase NifV
MMPADVDMWIVDTTLRDGEQTAGVAFTRKERLRIARLLAETGLTELEVGTPAMGDGEMADLRAISRLDLGCRLTAWCRARVDDVDRAAACLVNAVHLSVPGSPILLAAMGKSEAWVLDRIGDTADHARRHFDFVSLGVQDASRADPQFLASCARAARQAGVDRLRLADTVGIWNPFQVQLALAKLQGEVPGLPLGFHGHNDLGMATANTVAAVLAGAASVDVTVNGLGERAGNASLEEVVMALQLTADCSCGIDTRRFGELSSLVARASGRAIPPGKPIVGSGVFRHESGLHVRAIRIDGRAYEPFPASRVGHRATEFVRGKHSGPRKPGR